LIEVKVLWNPWRYEYVKSTTKPQSGKECLFCRLQGLSDEEALIVHRGRHLYVVLNAYPYNTGHLMIAPYKHVAEPTELREEELLELTLLINKSLIALRKALMAEGFNMGSNIGRAAGAGVPEHFHVHVVPRWVGDTNFLAVISGVKTLPMGLREAYELIKKSWVESA
jgi:ATP adenylyltransferase